MAQRCDQAAVGKGDVLAPASHEEMDPSSSVERLDYLTALLAVGVVLAWEVQWNVSGDSKRST